MNFTTDSIKIENILKEHKNLTKTIRRRKTKKRLRKTAIHIIKKYLNNHNIFIFSLFGVFF